MSKWVRVEEKSPVHSRSEQGSNIYNYRYQLKDHSEVECLYFSVFSHFFPELCLVFKNRNAALRFYNRVVAPTLQVKPRNTPDEMPLGLSFGNLLPLSIGKLVSQKGYKNLLAAIEKDLGEFSAGMKSVVNDQIIPLVDKWNPAKNYGSWKRSVNLDLKTVATGCRKIDYVCEGENLFSGISIFGETYRCTQIKLHGESAASIKQFCDRVNANPKFGKRLFIRSNADQIEISIKHLFPEHEYNNFLNSMDVNYFLNLLREYKDELKISDEMLEDISLSLSNIQKDMHDYLMQTLGV